MKKIYEKSGPAFMDTLNIICVLFLLLHLTLDASIENRKHIATRT